MWNRTLSTITCLTLPTLCSTQVRVSPKQLCIACYDPDTSVTSLCLVLFWPCLFCSLTWLSVPFVSLLSAVHSCYDTRFILFYFHLFNQLYYYCSHMTDIFYFRYCSCLPMTHQPWVSHGLHNTWASRPGESYVIDGEPALADPEILTYFMGQPMSAGWTLDVGPYAL